MKVNKITVIACSISILISGIGIILLKSFTTWQNIVMGIFTSSVVSCIIALINYFHERNIIIENIDNNIKNLYINMSLMFKVLEKTIPQIKNCLYFQDAFFNYILMLSEKNVEFLNDMKLGLFNPFFKDTKLYNICIQLLRFEDITYYLKNNVGNIRNQEAECNYELSFYNNTSNQSIFANQFYPPELLGFREQIITATAQLQEFVKVKLMDLENISADFYNRKFSREHWDTVKSNLLNQIENIIKGQ